MRYNQFLMGWAALFLALGILVIVLYSRTDPKNPQYFGFLAFGITIMTIGIILLALASLISVRRQNNDFVGGPPARLPRRYQAIRRSRQGRRMQYWEDKWLVDRIEQLMSVFLSWRVLPAIGAVILIVIAGAARL